MFVSSDFRSQVVVSTNTIVFDLLYISNTAFERATSTTAQNAATYLNSDAIINKNIHYDTKS